MLNSKTKRRRFRAPPTQNRFLPCSSFHFAALENDGGGGGGGEEERVGGRSLPRKSHLMSEVAAAAGDGVFGPTSEGGERRTVDGEGQRRRCDDDDDKGWLSN